MNRADRAKQFLPFDALKGLREELSRRERMRTRVERAVLSETQQKEISDALSTLKKGSSAEITRYIGGNYVSDLFIVKSVNAESRFIQTTDSKIYFDDLYSVKIVTEE